jgi:hypothetical protein
MDARTESRIGPDISNAMLRHHVNKAVGTAKEALAAIKAAEAGRGVAGIAPADVLAALLSDLDAALNRA